MKVNIDKLLSKKLKVARFSSFSQKPIEMLLHLKKNAYDEFQSRSQTNGKSTIICTPLR